MGSTWNVDMKCRDTMSRFGKSKCGPKCCSAAWMCDERREARNATTYAATTAREDREESDSGDEQGSTVPESVPAAAVPESVPAAPAVRPMPERRRRNPDHTPKCGRCCPSCDTSSHNHRRPLQFLTVGAIREQMGRLEGPLTLGEIADFYKVDVTQLIRWSTAAFVPEDLLGAPRCGCCFVQRSTFTYSGSDVTAPRDDTNVERSHLRCTAHYRGHELQRLMNQTAVWGTAGQTPTLGFWGRARADGGELGPDTAVTARCRRWRYRGHRRLRFPWCSWSGTYGRTK